MAYVRFPIPAFDHKSLRGLSWSEPAYLDDSGISARIAAAEPGAYPVRADAALFDALGVSGEHCHAYLCLYPSGARLLGRSHSWWLQRATVIDTLDPGAMNVIADWRTPRPINTRFGPEDGIDLPDAPVYVVASHAHGAEWVADRTLTQAFDGGYRIVATAKDDSANFDEFCLDFSWEA